MQRALNYVSVILVVLFFFLPANAAEEGGGAYYDLGVFAYEDGDYEVAEKNLLKAADLEPNNNLIKIMLANFFILLLPFDLLNLISVTTFGKL